jgi:hypothetical protein
MVLNLILASLFNHGAYQEAKFFRLCALQPGGRAPSPAATTNHARHRQKLRALLTVTTCAATRNHAPPLGTIRVLGKLFPIGVVRTVRGAGRAVLLLLATALRRAGVLPPASRLDCPSQISHVEHPIKLPSSIPLQTGGASNSR